MKVFVLNEEEIQSLGTALLSAFATGELRVAYDSIDQAIKFKVDGRWSPPFGVLEVDD